jgi:hypothetical protein
MMMGVQIPLMSVQIPLWVVALLLSSADFIPACMQEACYCLLFKV